MITDSLPSDLANDTFASRSVAFDDSVERYLAKSRLQQARIREYQLFPNSVGQQQLQVDSVIARHISVQELSAISADLGTVTAGDITLDSAGFIRGGATAYDTGVGFWMGYSGAAYKFFIGDSAGNKLLWDGSMLSITGSISATTGTIGGFNIGADYIRDTINSSGIASTITGGDDVRFWAGATFANRATAPFRVTEGGTVVGAGISFFANMVLKANQFNEVVTNALAEIRINYDGYAGGTTQFRDLAIYDGKNALVGAFTGASKSLLMVGTIGAANFSGTSSGTNTGDQTSVSGSSGSCTGNAATATTAGAVSGVTLQAGLGTGDAPTFAGLTLNGGVTSNGNSGLTGTYTLIYYSQIQIDNGIVTNLL